MEALMGWVITRMKYEYYLLLACCMPLAVRFTFYLLPLVYERTNNTVCTRLVHIYVYTYTMV